MNFVNNWSRPITLAAGALACPLDLPDGSYRLTLSDSALANEATTWEYIDAVVLGGSAELVRGREGTTAQEWAAGSVIYCAVTAGVLAELLNRVTALEAGATSTAAELAALTERVAVLEAAGGVVITSEPANSGGISGYSSYNGAGAILPVGATVYPGGEPAPGMLGEILDFAWSADWPFYGALQLRVRGDSGNWPTPSSLPFTSITLGGVDYLKADLQEVGGGDGNIVWEWSGVASDPFTDGANIVSIN